IWGVSESGYYAFDSRMNYQYRAFGLNGISYRGGGDGKVIAPYATLLALSVDDERSMKNLSALEDEGFIGEYGLYEAIDYDPDRVPQKGGYKIVKSYMTHHQGMIMMAIAEYLTNDELSRAFCERPDIRAYLPLTELKPQRAERKVVKARWQQTRQTASGFYRTAGRDNPDGHLIEGGGTTCFFAPDGMSLTIRDGFYLERFYHGYSKNEGTRTFVICDGEVYSWEKARFSPGLAAYSLGAAGVACTMTASVSGEDGAVYRQVELENTGSNTREIAIANVFAAAVSTPESYMAHPAFMNMFVYANKATPTSVAFSRRGRNGEEYPVALISVTAPDGAGIELENDFRRLLGRRQTLDNVNIPPREFTFTPGATLDPGLAQMVALRLNPSEKAKVVFTVEFLKPDQGYPKQLSLGDLTARVSRAAELNRARFVAATDFLSVDMGDCRYFDRQSRRLFFPRERLFSKPFGEFSKNDLWAMGLDLINPIIAVFASKEDDIPAARRACDRYLFYGLMGVKTDLALVCDEEVGYARPVWDALSSIADSCRVRDARCGNVRLIDANLITDANRAALKRTAAIIENERADEATKLSRERFEKSDYEPPVDGLLSDNGFGGFDPDNFEYVIRVREDFPAPWVNVIANENFGAIISERAGGFAWAGNSRLGRITAWTGDAQDEGCVVNMYLTRPDGRNIALLPVRAPALARHGQGESSFESSASGFRWKITIDVPRDGCVLRVRARVTNDGGQEANLTLNARCDFLMGADANDARALSQEYDDGFIFARGVMAGVGYIYMPGATLAGEGLSVPVLIPAKGEAAFELKLGWAKDEAEAREAVSKDYQSSREYLDGLLSALTVKTPDDTLNGFVNRWLAYQALSSRVFARAGFYQAGGAYGFRDQLQDMLAFIPLKPSMVRRHILYCAGHQFEAGDVMHWWHPPATGVRTRISDDCVFLPYVASQYALETGDFGIFETGVPYLEDAELPEDREDIYFAARPSQNSASLHDHCMRAIRLASRTGSRSLALMRGGDWNDGMNKIGGESVWLSEFIAATCEIYARTLDEKRAADAAKSSDAGDLVFNYAPDIDELRRIAAEMKRAVDLNAWDGGWYCRAFYADGEAVGGKDSKSCQIDLVAQSWAVLAGLDREKRQKAMDNAWKRLVSDGMIKLLTPAFTRDEGRYPGYIADYPPGVRENGGQYTHAACWAVMAWAKLGQSERAWKAFAMLLPYNHAPSEKEAVRYRVEPYVVAADIYSAAGMTGRGGWTWYTGAAAWMYRAIVYSLMGYERRANRVRLRAVLPCDWNEAEIRLRVGKSVYRLIARRGEGKVMIDKAVVEDGWIALADDGNEHVATFPVNW
ncbi:MAG: glucoamylase family protein, partial [Clostridia bacterium]|nr:glucoamylase family protein [Clostridia bacterium]